MKRIHNFPSSDTRARDGLYTIRETSAYLKVPKSTIHLWTTAPENAEALLTSLPAHGREPTIPFIGLAEAFVLAAFRKHGVPMQRIRPAVEILRREIGLEHALASRDLYSDGAEILFDFDRSHDRRNDESDFSDLYVVRTNQRQFTDTVRDYLKRITYGDDGWASRVELPAYSQAKVVVDPRIAFGQPFVATGGVRTEDLVDRFTAGDSVEEISEDFSIPADQVEDVIRVAATVAA